MFLLPISFYAKEQDQMERLFLLTETTYFVDSIRNTGVLTDSMLEKFEKKISLLSGFYQIEMEHASQIYTSSQDTYSFQQDCYYTKQILEELDLNGKYTFFQGDFFKVSIVEVKNSFGKRLQNLLLGITEQPETIAAYYGGMIRCEVE